MDMAGDPAAGVPGGAGGRLVGCGHGGRGPLSASVPADRRRAARLLLPTALALGLATAAGSAAAQQTATVAAGARYQAGSFHRSLWGGAYRDLWATPIRVPILAPDTFAGGLRVEQEGGGLATESLRMRGRDGREYVFRSVDKDPGRGLPPDLRGGPVQTVAQDEVANKHPASALVVDPLLTAVGILHVQPRLFVMPDHAFLGEHRERFAGRLGWVELRPEDDEDGAPAFAGAQKVVGTERLFERLEEDPRERLDAREYLVARLMDILVGDWDRHLDQWRWAGYKSGDNWRWRPVPRDRDNAFNDYAGLLNLPVRAAAPQFARWDEDYVDVPGLVQTGADLDRRLLSELDRAAWDSAVAFVRARVTDAVIEGAVRRMPAEYIPLNGEVLAGQLRSRRDHLGEAAGEFYALLASDVNVHSTDKKERAEVQRLPEGSVDVVIRSEGVPGTWFRRRFLPAETREVRLYLQGGDDQAVVRGTASNSIQVRLIGGGGDDVLADSGRAGARSTVIHDDRGDNRFVRGPGTKVDTRPYDPPAPRSLFGNPPAPRDWGADFAPISPYARWQPNVGPVLGAGPRWTRYGFRRQPYKREISLRGVYAPLEDGVGVEADADFRRTSSRDGLRLAAGARTFDVIRFHGLGNDSPGDIEEEYEVTHSVVEAQARWYGWTGSRASYSIGPVARWMDPRDDADRLAPLRGGDGLAQAGLAGGVQIDARDTLPVTRGGWLVRGGARALAHDAGAPFARVEGEGRAYLPLLGGGTSLALRAGGAVVRGGYPFQEAAYLGGGESLRGFPYQRFAGDAAAFGAAEVRQPVGQVHVLVRARVGVFGFGEAGRVWLDGESPGDWHPSWGGGAWFETTGRVVTLTYARADVTRLYAGFGLPF
jgi:hypothetical protein